MKYIQLYHAFFLSLIVTSTSLFAQDDTQNNLPKFNVIPVQSQDNSGSHIPIGGRVEAIRSVILAAQLPGRVNFIAGEEGDAFDQGALLIKLNDEDLLAQRKGAVSQWGSAMAAFHNANMQHSRNIISPQSTSQTPGGFGMPGMFDQIFGDPMQSFMGTRHVGVERDAAIYASSTQIRQADLSLRQALSQIERIDTKLRDIKSLAPFKGVITEKLVEKGDTVQPGQPLLEYEDLAKLQIVADIPVKLAKFLVEGDTLQARISTDKRIIDIAVANIFPKADPQRHTVTVKFNLPTDDKITSGIYAEVMIPKPDGNHKQAITILASAVTYRGGLPVVFVVNADRQVEMRMVRLGEATLNNRVEIHYGLNITEQLLNHPPAYIASGFTLPE
jgi:multidrug efflux pump subunit AcrA (membrane-fusion protein)